MLSTAISARIYGNSAENNKKNKKILKINLENIAICMYVYKYVIWKLKSYVRRRKTSLIWQKDHKKHKLQPM